MKRYTYIKTGGSLNPINEKYKINSILNNGKSMSEIIRTHKPKDEEELLSIITEEKIDKLGKQLFDAAIKEGITTTIEECQNYQYSLNIVNSYRGFKIEKNVLQYLIDNNVKAKEMTPEMDIKYNIDIVASDDNTILGIQVKPISYLYCSDKIKNINKKKNNDFKLFLQEKFPNKIIKTTNVYYQPNEDFDKGMINNTFSIE
jgi:Holliday junction resolvase-like predicted endonuclease